MANTTLLLDTAAWDLVVDAFGNIAVASEPYAMAQDAASAIKTFQGEVYFDVTVGVPYLAQILGKSPPIAVLKSLLVEAAETVPDVASAVVFLSSVANRTVSGQVQVTSAPTATSPAQTSAAAFSSINPQGT